MDTEWVSVKERLPTESKNYLVYTNYGTIMVLHFYHKKKKWISGDEYVTHWMPLPEPPKEEGDA